MLPVSQKQFLDKFEGVARGKYHNTILAIIRLLGGKELREQVQTKYGRPHYSNDEMYPSREVSFMIDYAAECGVPVEKLGRNSARTYERAFPEVFKDLTPAKAVDLIVLAYSMETSSTIAVKDRQPNSAVIERTNNPLPCDFFKGVIIELYEMIGVKAEVNEISCQWGTGGHTCQFEISWGDAPSSPRDQ